MPLVAGIDVGGKERGFLCAILDVTTGTFTDSFHESDAEKVCSKLGCLGSLKCIAIDCPPKASIKGPETRLAERELHRNGYRVQWTPRKRSGVKEWMLNGEKLWNELKKKLSAVELIETFPTSACESFDPALFLPSLWFQGRHKRKFYKDIIDACICADVAKRYLKRQVKEWGENDELGPIYA